MKKVICSEKAPGAIGPYSQAIEANGMVFVSGQLPIDAATGKMAEGIEEQARQSLENIKHILEETGLTMGNIVKTTVFLQDMSFFAGMNGVYATYFDAGYNYKNYDNLRKADCRNERQISDTTCRKIRKQRDAVHFLSRYEV